MVATIECILNSEIKCNAIETCRKWEVDLTIFRLMRRWGDFLFQYPYWRLMEQKSLPFAAGIESGMSKVG